jgi:Icc-related predicted phosphoesterase
MRDSGAAWRQVVGFLARAWATSGPWLVFSHAPPSGAGDDPSNPYHRGFPAYRFLLERLAPPLWLHGHTTRAGGPPWRIVRGKTTLLNVTGSVLIELRRPGSA